MYNDNWIGNGIFKKFPLNPFPSLLKCKNEHEIFNKHGKQNKCFITFSITFQIVKKTRKSVKTKNMQRNDILKNTFEFFLQLHIGGFKVLKTLTKIICHKHKNSSKAFFFC